MSHNPGDPVSIKGTPISGTYAGPNRVDTAEGRVYVGEDQIIVIR